MGLRVVVKYMKTDVFNRRIQITRHGWKTHSNADLKSLDSEMNTFIARGDSAQKQLSEFLVGKSLTILGPNVLGDREQDLMIQAKESICREPSMFLFEVGKKRWDFTEYRDIQSVRFISRKEAWKKEILSGFGLMHDHVNTLLRYWKLASCLDLRQSITALDSIPEYKLWSLYISQHNMEDLENVIMSDTKRRFWFVIGKSEEELFPSFWKAMEERNTRTIGEVRDCLRRIPGLKNKIAGMYVSRNFEASLFYQLHRKEIEAFCSHNKFVTPVHAC